VKGITKMTFPHFKRKHLRSINFDLIQCDDLEFHKEMHFMKLLTTSLLHTIMHTLKTQGSKVMV
jgi:hypothetical protein